MTFTAKQFNSDQSPMLKVAACDDDFKATIDRTTFGLDYGVSLDMTKSMRNMAPAEAVRKQASTP